MTWHVRRYFRRSLAVLVAVVRIRGVRMSMRHRLVPMKVGVRLFDKSFMGVLVMAVVHMEVLVLQRLVPVQVLVPVFRDEPEPGDHHGRSHEIQRL